MKYHFIIFPYLCTQKTKAPMVKVRSTLKLMIAMDNEIKNILTSWESSLVRYGKIDSWNYSENITTLGRYLRTNESTLEERYLIKYIRDSIIGVSFNVKSVLKAIQKLMNLEAAKDKDLTSMLVKMDGNRVVLNGQDVRFKKETEKIFKEKLKFKKGMLLRNFDIETEAPHDSKKVRRIVEKRMCQAYHRMHKKDEGYKTSNREKYWMDRATAFQLYNIGQKEKTRNTRRDESTHWKWKKDPITHELVLKKKMGYKNEKSAQKAIAQWKINHPYDSREITSYKCNYCNKWHIGHKSKIQHHPAIDSMIPQMQACC